MPETRKARDPTPNAPEEEASEMQKTMLRMQENSMRMQEQQAIMQQQIQQQMAQMMQITSGLLNKSADQLPTTRARRPDRPTLDFEATDTDWMMFLEDWGRYKQMSMLSTAEEVRNELRAACSKEVNRMLFSFVGPDTLKDASEEDLLDYIKSVAVRSVHKEVHRQEFKVMKQEEGETVTRFAARLKAKAMQCKFSTQCDIASCVSKCSYAEEMISSQIISGIRNGDHRGKILAEMEDLDTLQKLINRLLALECTQRASVRFVETPCEAVGSTIALQKSGYRKQQSFGKPRQDPKKNELRPKYQSACQGCGMRSHGSNKSMIREQDCPAWGQKCHKCKQQNHFQAVCRGSQSRTAASGTHDQESDDDPDVSFLSATRSRSDSF